MVVWKEFGIVNSFTLEASFFGYSVQREIVTKDSKEMEKVNETVQYSEKDYCDLGMNFCKSNLL